MNNVQLAKNIDIEQGHLSALRISPRLKTCRLLPAHLNLIDYIGSSKKYTEYLAHGLHTAV